MPLSGKLQVVRPQDSARDANITGKLSRVGGKLDPVMPSIGSTAPVVAIHPPGQGDPPASWLRQRPRGFDCVPTSSTGPEPDPTPRQFVEPGDKAGFTVPLGRDIGLKGERSLHRSCPVSVLTARRLSTLSTESSGASVAFLPDGCTTALPETTPPNSDAVKLGASRPLRNTALPVSLG